MSFLPKNMELLGKRNPELAEVMEHTAVPEVIRVLRTSSGSPTLLWAEPASKPRFLHSPKDPQLEAERLIERRAFRNQDGTLLLGLGLGYLANAVFRKKEPHHLLCIAEAIPGLFRAALENSDLSDLLSDEETHFFIGDGIGSLLDGFRPLRLKAISGDFGRLALPRFLEIYNGFYDEVETQIHECLSALRQAFSTFLATKDCSVSNLFENVPTIMNSQAVDSLKGLIQDKPAIVVAAGPSLSRELETLKKVRPRCFVICVDTALKPLLENGILPDLAVSCDSHAMSLQKIAKVPRDVLARTPLIFCADTCSKVVESFGATRFVTSSDTSLSRWLLNLGRKVSTLPHYGTVAHLGFAVARFMAADPIILVGLDLSFPGKNAHAEGCTAPWELDEKRCRFIPVPSNCGAKARTNLSFLTMIRQFEQDIGKTRARCVNVSRDGALIRGAEWMGLEEAAGLGGGTSLDVKPLLAEAYDHGFRNPAKELLSSLHWLLREVEDFWKHIPAADSPKSCGDKLVDVFSSCMGQKSFLNVLLDYFPRYLLSFHTLPMGGFPRPDGAQESGFEKQASLFLEEAREIIPLLKTGCREAIRSLGPH